MGMQASMIDSCVRGYQGTRTGYLLIEHSVGSKIEWDGWRWVEDTLVQGITITGKIIREQKRTGVRGRSY